jgi:cardiolipin synthase
MKRRSTWRNFSKPYLSNHTAEWLVSGPKYFERFIELIDQATQEIQLQTYIFIDDETGKMVGEALLRAAERGVSVFVLIDAYGSQAMTSAFRKRLEEAGIHLRNYGELYSKGRFHIGRRLHRKILLIDGHTAVIGGINIANHYAGTNKMGPWLDFAIVVSGPVCSKLEMICRQRWKDFKFKKTSNSTQKPLLEFKNLAVRVRRNDFIHNQNEITITYRQAIRRAEKSLTIVGGYFLPGGRTRRLLKAAVRRGVEINVLVAEKSDVGIMVNARKYLYGWLAENGIHVYEYHASNVHGKVLVVDAKWTTIGSYDLNNLSTYSNIELNLDINNILFSENLYLYIKDIMMNRSKEVTAENSYLKENIFTTFKNWLSYRFVKIMFVLTFLLAGKREKEFPRVKSVEK